MTQPEFEFNPGLVDDLARRRGVLFLGSGVSASARTRSGGRIKDWVGFLNACISQIGDAVDKKLAVDALNDKDHLLCAEICARALGSDDWRQLAINEFSQIADPSPLHEAIWRLNQRLIVTTNYDKLLEDSYAKYNKQSTRFPDVFVLSDNSILKVFRTQDDAIVKLHGTIDKPEDIILTRSDYVQGAFSSAAYENFLFSMMTNYTVIFIGFSFTDPWVLQIIEKAHFLSKANRPHYAFMKGPVAQRIKDIQRTVRGVSVIEYPGDGDHGALPPLLAKLAAAVQRRQKEIFAAIAVAEQA